MPPFYDYARVRRNRCVIISTESDFQGLRVCETEGCAPTKGNGADVQSG